MIKVIRIPQKHHILAEYITKCIVILLFILFASDVLLAESVVQDISLNGTWKFTYRPELEYVEEKEPTPVIPEKQYFEVDINVPGYWDDQRDNFKKASWWSEVFAVI